ncbi:MAG: Mrp/NBP35 family ATP-binding protein [Elusimicrobia bacterium]|nr:Mrp/NBP35 family ATP-binding protein [Elusimicrobiota bacterium]
MDPRTSVIKKRFSKVKRVIAVTGWKGGIGKSVTASMLSLILAQKGKACGLLDLDFTGASDCIILGAKDIFPEEKNGIVPPEINGIKFMSIYFFSDGKAVPLRGNNITDAIIEMLAITQWGKLDYLIIDMPPGINDTALDVVRLIDRTEILALTIPSIIAKDVLERSLELYKRLKVPIVGIIKNNLVHSKGMGLEGIPYDDKLETALGCPDKLLKTKFAISLEKIISGLLK